MLSASEIARGTRGALKFLQRDPAAVFEFENTREACLRSFRVMVLAAPLYAAYLLLRYFDVPTRADDVEIVFVEMLHYVVDWLLYPVLFWEIARRRDWLARFPRYIGALNWINLPAIALMLLGEALTLAMPQAGQVLALLLQILFFYWFLSATRMTLAVSWPFAVLLLVVNWVPSFFLSLIVDRVLGVGLPGA